MLLKNSIRNISVFKNGYKIQPPIVPKNLKNHPPKVTAIPIIIIKGTSHNTNKLVIKANGEKLPKTKKRIGITIS